MSDIAFKYTGKGQASYGVPARDLTQTEYDGLSPDLKREVLKGGRYQKVGKKSPVPPKAEQGKSGQQAKKDGE